MPIRRPIGQPTLVPVAGPLDGLNLIPKTLLDAKGDILVASAADTPARLPVGANGRVLLADSAQSTGLKWSTAAQLEGNGSPEGVKTADPGTTYTDLLGTNGAWRWIKISGTGNTGWKVEYGDTGNRDITSLLTYDFQADDVAPYFVLRRVGPMVWLGGRLDLKAGSASGTRTFGNQKRVCDLPTGFTPILNYAMFGTGSGLSADSSAVWPVLVGNLHYGAGNLTVVPTGSGNWTALDNVDFGLALMTGDAWPTGLPGTAA